MEVFVILKEASRRNSSSTRTIDRDLLKNARTFTDCNDLKLIDFRGDDTLWALSPFPQKLKIAG